MPGECEPCFIPGLNHITNAHIRCAVIIFIILGLGSKGTYQIDALKATQDTGSDLVGDVLSFAG